MPASGFDLYGANVFSSNIINGQQFCRHPQLHSFLYKNCPLLHHIDCSANKHILLYETENWSAATAQKHLYQVIPLTLRCFRRAEYGCNEMSLLCSLCSCEINLFISGGSPCIDMITGRISVPAYNGSLGWWSRKLHHWHNNRYVASTEQSWPKDGPVTEVWNYRKIPV